jgi:MFS family permease
MGLSPDGIPEPPPQSEPGPQPNLVVDEKWAVREWTLPEAVRTYRFWAAFMASFFMWGIAFNLLANHLTAFLALDVGYPKLFAAFIFSLYGLVYALGNLGGFISDRIGREKAITLGGAGAILATSLLFLIRDPSQVWLPYLFAVAIGLSTGLMSGTLPTVAADLFQGKNFGLINGVIVIGFGIGGAIGPWLGGYLHDVTGSYDLTFLLVMAAIGASVALVWVSGPGKVRAVGSRARLAGHPL